MRNLDVANLFTTKDETLSAMSTIFDKLFKDAFPEFETKTGINFATGHYPKIAIVETNKEVKVFVDIPGWNKEDISIVYDNNILTVSGTKKKPSQEIYGEVPNPNKVIYSELKESNFKRSLAVSKNANLKIDSLEASFNNGRLTITIPTLEETKNEAKSFSIK